MTAECYGESGRSGSHLHVLGYLNASHLVQSYFGLFQLANLLQDSTAKIGIEETG